MAEKFVPIINSTYKLTRPVRYYRSFTTVPSGTPVLVTRILDNDQCVVVCIYHQFTGRQYVVPFGMVNPANLDPNTYLRYEVFEAWQRVPNLR